jgi:hypothetical protein
VCMCERVVQGREGECVRESLFIYYESTKRKLFVVYYESMKRKLI